MSACRNVALGTDERASRELLLREIHAGDLKALREPPGRPAVTAAEVEYAGTLVEPRFELAKKALVSRR